MWLKELKTHSSPDIKVFLIGNKVDLVDERKVTEEEAKKFKEDYMLNLYMETSAKTGFNAREIFIEAARVLYREYNKNHNVKDCVGYIITLSSGVSIYISGDTSKTKQMNDIKNIDYAFYCCDGVYNMDIEEAIEAAKLVGAKHSIPYHITGDITDNFDKDRAQKFNVSGRLILENGQEIDLNK